MTGDDTIAAISSAVGAAARMIVRMSGAEASRIARQLLVDADDLPPASAAQLCLLQVRPTLRVRAWVYRFVAPRSATGEDTVEFHLPGNPLLARILLDELIARGARQAEPGEFTARSYFNGRVGLSEAEGVAATIGARSQAELDAARRLMAGELARRLTPIMDQIVQMLALIEVGIDFADEDVTFLQRDQILEGVTNTDEQLERLLRESRRFERLAHEPQIVLAGRPNAGKSTLLNALAGHERAVVSDVPGTTRDVIGAPVALKRGLVRIFDVAGLEERESPDAIEQQMQAASHRALEGADVLVFLRDARDGSPTLLTSRKPDLVVATKLDLGPPQHRVDVAVSAVSGAGMAELCERLDDLAFGTTTESSSLALNARHVRAIADARESLGRAVAVIDAGPELIALELRDAIDALGSILGQVTPDDVLTRVFSAFCIGK